MADTDQLRRLFVAFREQNASAFQEVAEAIIAEELAANHYAKANELKKALGNTTSSKRTSARAQSLSALPRDRRDGQDLLILQKSSVDSTRIILGRETRPRVDRILLEHHKRSLLAQHGLRPKSKLLFWGPPGCGKTFTAHHLAYELGWPIATVRLSAVISSFLGDTASHLQRIFDAAASQPMVLLLDEVDAVGKNRDDPHDVGELKRVVNSLLQAMDSFTAADSVVIAASNHQYLLDPALWRRFDDIVHFPPPGKAEREVQLRNLLRGVRFAGSLARLTTRMTGLSYADNERIVTEAVKTMILDGRQEVTESDIAEQLTLYRKALKDAQVPGTAAQDER